MSGGKKQTIGYWYSLGMHLGFCHGPVDAFLEIQSGGRTAWAGNVTGNTRISINNENLFGGKKREGGIVGALDVMMGGPTQTANDYLAAKQGVPQPGYRGFFGAVFRGGKIAANNPYVKPWAIRARRIFSGWDTEVWYPEKASIDLGNGVVAMNPAHIIFECLTNGQWGLGYPSGKLDLPSFAAAADTFHAEGFGLCIQWVQQESIANFVQIVCDHVGAAVGEDPRTGLFRMRAIRDDYSIDDLQVFGKLEGNIISLDKFDRASQTEALNELTVGYTNGLTGEDASITVHRLASIRAQGAVVPQTRSYPGLMTLDLATRVGNRDLRAAGAGIARVSFTATRDAYALLPGDVVAFSWPEYGINLMPLRIAKINYGSLTRGEIQIDAVQDLFGLQDTTYISPPAIGWEPPDTTPQASTAVVAFEAPYREIVASAGASVAAALSADAGFLATVARRPSGLSIQYALRTRIGTAPYVEVGDGDWTPTATLAAGISPTTTIIPIAGGIDLDLVDIGTAAMIGTEIVRIDAIDVLASTITVARGCADTVPKPWSTGTRVWCFDEFSGADPTQYIATEVVDAKVVTLTTTGELAESSAPTASVTFARRAARPYPPGALKLNGAAYPASISGPLTVSWAHRDRLLQQDTLVATTDGDIGPEPGTTYTLRLYGEDGTLRRTETGLTGTSYTWSSELADAGVTYSEVISGITFSQSSAYSGITATATNMRDGLGSTGGGTNATADEWIQADLGSSYSIGRVALAAGDIPVWGPVAPYLNGALLQYSTDGSSWTTVLTVSGVANDSVLVNFEFGAVTARYWRLHKSTYLATSEFRLYEASGATALNTQVRVVLEAVRDGLTSWQAHDVTVPRV